MIEPPCKHDPLKTIKHGIRYNKNNQVQKYMCTQCFKKFSFGVNKKKILTKGLLEFCVTKYSKGVSLRRIEKLVMKKFHIKINHGSILKWVNIETDLFKISPYHKKLLLFEKQKAEAKIKRLLKDKELFKIRYEKIELKIAQFLFRLEKIDKKLKEDSETTMNELEKE